MSKASMMSDRRARVLSERSRAALPKVETPLGGKTSEPPQKAPEEKVNVTLIYDDEKGDPFYVAIGPRGIVKSTVPAIHSWPKALVPRLGESFNENDNSPVFTVTGVFFRNLSGTFSPPSVTLTIKQVG